MFTLPDIEILPRGEPGKTEDSEAIVETLTKTFSRFNVGARVTGFVRGPMVTRYEVELSPGVPVRKVESLKPNLAYSVGSSDIRIISPIPGRSAIGIEIPNPQRDMVQFRDVLETISSDKPHMVGFGRDIDGDNISIDISKMPHLLLAGATGSGKSVFLNTLITSVLMRAMPWEVQFVLVDPKQMEFSFYAEIPHLLHPVITDMPEAGTVLEELCDVMDSRTQAFSDAGVKSLDAYNERFPQDPMARIVVVIDEMADLMMQVGDGAEDSIVRIAQKARAVGINLVLATQRPTVEFVSGAIKANMPSRLAFNVASNTDSRVILDEPGAQQLLGMGDSLYLPAGASSTRRVQGAFISDDDITRIANHWREQAHRVSQGEVIEPIEPETYEPKHAGDRAPETVASEPVEPKPTVVPRFYGANDDKREVERFNWIPLLEFTFKLLYGTVAVSINIAVMTVMALCGTRGMGGEAIFMNMRNSQIYGQSSGGGTSLMGSSRGRQQSRVNNTPGHDGGINTDIFRGE